ncbi:hypothetical protein [Natrinema halophilum]|uniref:Uncharacterized protein n=1 Tax=Natrinema halophilum TaxID=1699371 RepID=A0A7D5GI67_9EURY|nr:hypothetical protein [Natrinema halophilum]QLG49447.1 hypothetical protein HYG82_11520 [Natrinema halophilum]
MQLEQPSQGTARTWSGTVPSAVDPRVLGLIVVTAGLAASINVPYGGWPAAAAAFALLSGGGIALHVLGERKLRRITDGLVERWDTAGGRIEDVTRSSNGMQTEWRVHTPDGEIVIGGIALIPIARLTIEWRGIGDTMAASEAESNLDQLAAGLYREIFEFDSTR